MTEETKVRYAGTSIFMDFTVDSGVVTNDMTCDATLLDESGSTVGTYTTNKDAANGLFELRIPYTETTTFKGQLHTLKVQATDTTTGYSDVIYEEKISWI